MLHRTRRIAAVFALVACGTAAAHAAETYPARPVRWVVATAPGGGVDAIAAVV